jgi:hypothetical protein
MWNILCTAGEEKGMGTTEQFLDACSWTSVYSNALQSTTLCAPDVQITAPPEPALQIEETLQLLVMGYAYCCC